MYRIAIVVAVILLGLALERVSIFKNGATADKPAAAKSDRQKIDVPPPPGLQDRADVKPPAAKVDREKIDHDTAKQPPAKADRQEVASPEKPPIAAVPPAPAQPATKQEAEKPPAVKVEREEKKPPVAKVTPAPAPEQRPAVKPQRESKRHHARPARHVVGSARRAYADVRHNAVRGDDAQAMRARKAWLRALAQKYGYSDW